MMTEDELRARLHDTSAGITPPGDLLDTLAKGHARRHKRVRSTLVGGSIAATALVVALLGSLFASGPDLPVDPAAAGKQEVIKRAEQASAAANSMIMSFRTYQPLDTSDSAPTAESWALRSEKSARILFPQRMDTIVRAPGFREDIDLQSRTVTTNDHYNLGPDVVANVSGSSIGDVTLWLRDKINEVRRVGAEIHITGERMNMPFEMWLDASTYLPTRATIGSYRMVYEWLPATAENRKLLEHTVPPDFTRRTQGPDGAVTTIPPTN